MCSGNKLLYRRREFFSRINIYLVYLILPFLPIMIPFYKIEPEFLCSRGLGIRPMKIINFNSKGPDNINSDKKNYINNDFEILFYTCEKEKICNSEYEEINGNNLYHSLKYSYYLNQNSGLNEKIKINCNSTENSESFFIDYFYPIYYFGVILGSITYSRINKNKMKIALLITFISLFLFFLFTIIYISVGFNINSIIFLVFILNSGILFNFVSTIAIEQYLKITALLKDKIAITVITKQINMLYCLSGLIHMGVFYFYKHWISNFILFLVIAIINFLICLLLECQIDCNDICPSGETAFSDALININTSSAEKFRKFLGHSLALKSKKLCVPSPKNQTDCKEMSQKTFHGNLLHHHSKSDINNITKKLKKLFKYLSSKNYAHYMNFILFLLVSANYQMINSNFDHYSYSPFKSDTDSIFIFGFIIYSLEFTSLITLGKITNKSNDSLLNLSSIFILGVSLTILQICLLNKDTTVLIIGLSIEKLFLMFLCQSLKERIQLGDDFLLNKNGYKITIISHLGVIINFILTNYTQYSFLVLACMYYICFILLIKLIK